MIMTKFVSDAAHVLDHRQPEPRRPFVRKARAFEKAVRSKK